MTTSQKRPTQREVAQRAGVSQATVSHVLSGGSASIRVPDATRQRVLAAMQQLGYVPNVAAQRLAGGRNRILGVFTYEPVFPSGTRDFFSPFLEGIEEAAAELDYDLLLHTRPASAGGVRPLYRGETSRLTLADGTLMLGLLDDDRRRDLARLIHEGHPVVFIGRRELPGAALLYVTAGYAAATAQALGALAERGHRRTLYLGAASANESADDRAAGYLSALRERHVSGEVVRRDHLDEAFVDHQLRRGVTGVLVENERLTSQWLSLAPGWATTGRATTPSRCWAIRFITPRCRPAGRTSGCPDWRWAAGPRPCCAASWKVRRRVPSAWPAAGLRPRAWAARGNAGPGANGRQAEPPSAD